MTQTRKNYEVEVIDVRTNERVKGVAQIWHNALFEFVVGYAIGLFELNKTAKKYYARAIYELDNDCNRIKLVW